MKTPLIPALFCMVAMVCGADVKPGPDAAVVSVLDSPLPSEDGKRPSFLWDTFSNKPEETQFASYKVDKWKVTYWSFVKSLVEKARAQNLDSFSLGKALYLVLKDSNDRLAYLPVGAYQTTCEGKLVWIIAVKWESPAWGDDAGLGHIRMFAFEQATLRKVGYVTCK